MQPVFSLAPPCFSRRRVSRHLYFILACVLVVLMAACGSSPVRDGGPDSAIASQVGNLLSQAETSDSPERDKLYLQAAQILADAGETDRAGDLLRAIDADVLFSEDFVNYTLLYSQAAMADNTYFLAQRILTNPRVEQQWGNLSPANMQKLRERRAEVFALLGESENSVAERINLSTLNLTAEQQAGNQDAIWRSLMTLPQTELEARSREETGSLAKGWYSLAAISKNNQSDLERQLALIDQWMLDWPDHPASYRLPKDLQLLQQLVASQPRVVGLLLPLTGRFAATGKALRDGFMAAYYEAKRQGSFTPELRLFDTNGRDINEVYDFAIQDGAQAIIGPFFKEDVDELSLRLEMPVPTLALNTIDTQFGLPANLYQFGLPVEDEARQIAQRAWLEGHRSAMVLIQQTETGKRARDTFAREWQELGGTVVQSSYFSDRVDFQAVIKQSLLIDDSEQRGQDIRRLLGREVHFEEARRRQDLDLIFMMARPQDASLLKPTLDFYFASDVPIYATRHIYSGLQNRQTNEDLNSIRFTTLPWWFNDSTVKRSIVQNASPNTTYQPFYAMGVDAYRLYPRLLQLEQVADIQFYGNTGALSMGDERRLSREQTWAQFKDGQAIPLPTVVSDSRVDSR